MPAIGQYEMALSRRGDAQIQENACGQRFHLSCFSRCDNCSSKAMQAMAEVVVGGRSTHGLASRYESLIRLAEAIRSHRDHEDLFQFLADELRDVVPFDAMARFDHAGNRVNWHFSEACDTISQVSDIPNEETVAWWVHQTQQPLVIQVADEETRFHSTIEALNRNGLRSLCAFPLITAHQRLGSLVFANEIADAYFPA